MSGQKVTLDYGTVVTSVGTDKFISGTNWGAAYKVKEARASMEMFSEFGSGFLAVPAYQTANDKLNPDAAVAIPVSGGTGGYADSEKFFPPSTTVTVATAGKEHIRFGWLIKSAGGLSGAWIGGTVYLND